MTNKSLLLIGTLALSTVAVAGPKTYDLLLANPLKAGSVQLAPGDYKLRIDGSNVVFTDVQTHKSQSVPVKIENADQKYAATTLDATKHGDTEQIDSIELGGSKIKLEFGQ